jgi:transposase
LKQARIEGNSAAGFAQMFGAMKGKSKVVIEACWNWGKVYDTLEAIPEVSEVVLANPLKTRLIAEAQIKTDKVDSEALATLLRGNLVARAHVPAKATRQRKDAMRQRLCWARLRTRIRNRVHALLDRQNDLSLPQCSDLFGAKGMHAIRALQLPEPDATMLAEDVALLDLVAGQIRQQEKRIAAQNSLDPATRRLASLPGMGIILASVAAVEIDGIERFCRPDKLCAYAGLVPTTSSSGGKTYNGPLLPSCNKWLRWAFIEAAWVAVGCSGYFGRYYKKQRARGKKANTAITIVARRMCRIAWQLLSENRDFHTEPIPGRARKPISPAAPIAA